MERFYVCECSVSEWQENVLGDEANLFDDPRWVGTIGKRTGRAVFVFVKNHDHRIVAKAIGLALRGQRIGGDCLYFYTYPILAKNIGHLAKSIEKIKGYAARLGFSQVIVDYYNSQADTLEGVPLGFLPYKRIEYVVQYGNGSANRKLTSSIKGKIKQACKTNAYVEEVGSECVPYFLELIDSTRKSRLEKNRNDYNPFALPLFGPEDIVPLMQNGMIKLFACRDGQTSIHFIALCVMGVKGVYGLMNGCDDFGYQNGYPGFAIDFLIRKFQQEQYEYFNMGPIPNDQGNAMATFKTGLGAVPVVTYGLKTDFLVFPFRALNPLVKLARKMPYGTVVKKLSKIMRV